MWLVLAVLSCDRPGPSRSLAPEGSVEIALPLRKVVREHVAGGEYLIVADGDSLHGNLKVGDDDVARGSILGVPAASSFAV